MPNQASAVSRSTPWGFNAFGRAMVLRRSRLRHLGRLRLPAL